MKRIIIVAHAMEIGGAERALLGLLDALDYSKVNVELFLLRHNGALLPFINSNVRLLPEKIEYACLMSSIIDVIKHGFIQLALRRLWGKFKARIFVKSAHLSSQNDVALQYMHKFTKAILPEISSTEYDLAISFLTPHYLVAEKVKAKKLIAWIHTDYSKVDFDIKSALEMWNRYDYIMSISENVTQTFLQKMPSLESKVIYFPNLLPTKLIWQQANEKQSEIIPCNDEIHLLSIGRFCEAKNFDNVPEICRYIIQAGMNVKWYLLGFGGDEPLIREKITEIGMEDRVIILGKKDNPYPYIKVCDIYIQPSRYEGNCVAVHEAQMLGKPVVITKYATSASQLEDGVDGVIVPMDNFGCAHGIIKVLQDKELQNKLIANCQIRNYSNANEVQKLYSLLEI